MEELQRKVESRRGHRGYLTNSLAFLSDKKREVQRLLQS